MSVPLTKPRHERYALERALGKSAREAARIAGYDPKTGVATRLERPSHPVQARISELRALDDQMMKEKRARVEQRLTLAMDFNLLEFSNLDEATGLPAVDWARLKDSDYAVAVNEFNFDKDSGELTKIKRDDALAAAAQLRDMHGFKAPPAPQRLEHAGVEGAPITVSWKPPLTSPP